MAKRFNIEGEYRSEDSLTNDYIEQVTIPLKYEPQDTQKVSHANNKRNEQNPVVQEYNEQQTLIRRRNNLRDNKPDYRQDRRKKQELKDLWIDINAGANEIEMGDN